MSAAGPLVGIDLGTSAVKVVATDPAGRVLARATRAYPILTPAPGWAEQNPAAWWTATCAATSEVLRAAGAGRTVRGVGLSGQMHGLVALDAAGTPVRPAIIWLDTRSTAAVAAIRAAVGADRAYAVTGAPVTTGFLAPSLRWLRDTEPDAFARVRAVLLPKDYLRWRLTGRLATDPSDASGTLLWDLRAGDWSAEILTALELPPELLPPVQDSAAVAGAVTAAAAEQTGLPAGTPVVTGAGDLMAAAVALGIAEPGPVASVIGTGGQLITSVAEPLVDPARRVQTFAHALPGRWLLLGALLAAGQSLDWLARITGGDPESLVAAAEPVPPGADGLLFLPYLNGVRTPHVDPAARGCFVGLSLAHGRGHLARAVLEGVAFGMRECLAAVRDLGVRPAGLARPAELVVAGGGARLALWRQIQADVFGEPVRVPTGGDHSARGAAGLAAIGTGLPVPAPDPGTAIVTPDPARQARYDAAYERYRQLYPALRVTFGG